MEDEDESPVKLKPSKKRRYSVDDSHCFICKEAGHLRTPRNQRRQTFIDSFIERGKCGPFDLDELINIIDVESRSFKDEFAGLIRWHKDFF